MLIVTPGQLARRSEFYMQLGQLTAAGLGLISALHTLERNPPAASYRQPIRQLLRRLDDGCVFAEALESLGHWVPIFDIALLRAGEQSGRLDASFRLLANYYADRAQIARQLISDLAYPAFVLHFAVFILPFAQFFASGNWLRYLGQTFGMLLPMYGLVALAIYALQSRHGENWRAGFERVLHPVPLLGAARRYLALARLAAALEGLLSAGVLIAEAWELAAKASGSPALSRTVLAWRPLIDGGQTPAEVAIASGRFPELFANQYASGEISGKLEETLLRLHRYYQEEGSRKLHALAHWVPRAVYLIVALAIAYRVVSFYSGYFKMVQDAGGF